MTEPINWHAEGTYREIEPPLIHVTLDHETVGWRTRRSVSGVQREGQAMTDPAFEPGQQVREQQIPDVTDPDIREMVLRDHEPDETWAVTGNGNKRVFVFCRKCWSSWPCPSITAARAAEEHA